VIIGYTRLPGAASNINQASLQVAWRNPILSSQIPCQGFAHVHNPRQINRWQEQSKPASLSEPPQCFRFCVEISLGYGGIWKSSLWTAGVHRPPPASSSATSARGWRRPIRLETQAGSCTSGRCLMLWCLATRRLDVIGIEVSDLGGRFDGKGSFHRELKTVMGIRRHGAFESLTPNLAI